MKLSLCRETHPVPRGRYVIQSGHIGSRHCCSHCDKHSTWEQRVFIDAEYRGNVSAPRQTRDLATEIVHSGRDT